MASNSDDSDLTSSFSILAEEPLSLWQHERREAVERARRTMEAARANVALAMRNLRDAERLLEEAKERRLVAAAVAATLRPVQESHTLPARDTLTWDQPTRDDYFADLRT